MTGFPIQTYHETIDSISADILHAYSSHSLKGALVRLTPQPLHNIQSIEIRVRVQIRRFRLVELPEMIRQKRDVGGCHLDVAMTLITSDTDPTAKEARDRESEVISRGGRHWARSYDFLRREWSGPISISIVVIARVGIGNICGGRERDL